MGKLISLPENTEGCELGVKKKTIRNIIVQEDSHRFIKKEQLDLRPNAKRAIKDNELE